MKLQQLRYLCEIVNRNFSVSGAAEALHTSQPSVSRQIHMLEEELGTEIFVRAKKRLTGLTQPGTEIFQVAKRMLQDSENLRKISEDFSNQASGEFTIAASHTHARYALPEIIKKFAEIHPSVRVTLRQGSPPQMLAWVQNGEADIAISTEPVHPTKDVLFLHCYKVDRVVLVPPTHSLLKLKKLTLETLSRYPIITYETEFVGYTQDIRAFTEKNLQPNIVLRATDADVMKTYVRAGLGIAITSALAYDKKADYPLRQIQAKHLFTSNSIVIEARKHQYFRKYVYDFINLFSPNLSPAFVKNALFKEN